MPNYDVSDEEFAMNNKISYKAINHSIKQLKTENIKVTLYWKSSLEDVEIII